LGASEGLTGFCGERDLQLPNSGRRYVSHAAGARRRVWFSGSIIRLDTARISTMIEDAGQDWGVSKQFVALASRPPTLPQKDAEEWGTLILYVSQICTCNGWATRRH
jgi:hypothetical protein